LEQRVKEHSEKKKVLDKFIKGSLTKDIDYGSISMKRKRRDGTYYEVDSKPTLFKPGAEKIADLFNVRADWVRDNDTWEMLGSMAGLVCYVCYLRDSGNEVVGEGRGTAKTDLNQDFDINKQVKIAKKRAFVDAVLTTFSLSEYFTQDIEDMPQDDDEEKEPVEEEVLTNIKSAINSLNLAKTQEQLDAILNGIVKSEKYEGKDLYLIKQHADKRSVDLKKIEKGK
jgi:hypothetical protein